MKKTHAMRITTKHLNRRAIVYRRSSMPPQTEWDGTGFYQTTIARQWGWPKHAIEVIDEGPVGNGVTMEHRPGYQRLCGLIANGEVGIVLVRHLNRLTRSAEVLAQFYDLCRQHGTLVAVDGVVMDDSASDPSDRLMQQFLGVIAEFDNRQRVFKLREAKRSARAASRRRAA